MAIRDQRQPNPPPFLKERPRKQTEAYVPMHVPPPVGRPVNYVLEGSDAGSAVTEIELQHGGIALSEVGIPVTFDVVLDRSVGIALRGDAFTGGATWSLVMQVRAPGATSFADFAVATVTLPS